MKRLYTSLLPLLIGTASLEAQTCGQVIFEDDFENGTLGSAWTALPTDSSDYPSAPGGLIDVWFNGSDFDLRMGRTSDGSALTLNSLDLHLDLSSYATEPVDLYFDLSRYTSEENTQAAFEGLWLSDGTDTVFVFHFNPSDWCDGWGFYPPISLSDLATTAGLTLNENFMIRFRHMGVSDFNGSGNPQSGIYLDNVRVCARNTTPATLPFCDGFEDAQLSPSWRWSFPNNNLTENGAELVPGETAIGNVTRLHDRVRRAAGGSSSATRLEFGRICNDDGVTPTVVAMDLYLDLSNHSAVDLTFDVDVYGAETNPAEDAVFMSDDGGASFKRIFNLDPGPWEGGAWGRFPPLHLDKLAADSGLVLNSTVVVRFQQQVDEDLDGSGSPEDAFYLDNVCVADRDTTRLTIPICEDFEDSGILPPGFTWESADATLLPATEPTSPYHIVGIANEGHNSQRSVRFGRYYAGTLLGSAMDLHLDLSGTADVALDFFIKDFNEEPHPQDGLWFSDDGGETWPASLTFDINALPNGTYAPIHVNLDSMITLYAMQATSEFIVRFQEYDDDDFDTSGDEDGIYIDDVCISGSGVGVPHHSASRLLVQPNPTNGQFSLSINTNASASLASIITTLGQRILTLPLNGNKRQIIDLTPYENGVYFVEVRYADGTRAVERIVKQ